ncbi:hypothetical protein NQ176_g4490 [Zarea fungicola]|uniref:Uncharacterized protein n=1 Tax=Zarea fungicola TaxID=93591 RepID=A0ACC1NE33_9HYPO|nr:hypothetical protein NQ176_g4490 [Lecanicillium fungicola]
MNDAMFQYCHYKFGDPPRFMTTAFIARDLERIRQSLGEDELTTFMFSYGTRISQTYAAMFPNSVGRMILDGNEFFSAYRKLGSFASDSFEYVTEAWHDGLLAYCVTAGPKASALAKSTGNEEALTLRSLEKRVESLLNSILNRPIPAYSDTSGPGLVAYTFLVGTVFGSMYLSPWWPRLAELLFSLESGDSSTALKMMNREWWTCEPGAPGQFGKGFLDFWRYALLFSLPLPAILPVLAWACRGVPWRIQQNF